ncbi:unnamed protein product [Ectocarpus sp. CCAP 1310/34]|nr:unnamed protein product [Ectocarpus sp. CCAP 1310/34]
MSSSAATYLVLVTVALSVTYLSFLMYSAYGLGAVKAAAPFVGTVALVFAVAHCLDRAHEAEDTAKAAPKSTQGGGTTAKPTATTPAIPKRRRIAD